MVRRVYDKLKRVARQAVYSAGAEHLVYRGKGNDRLIVVYHGILPVHDTRFNLRFCAVDTFREHLKYFRKNYSIVPLEEIYSAPAAQGKKLIAITFDDGYHNNYKYSFPILEEMKVPSTIFCTSITSTGADHLWTDALDILSYFLEAITVDGLVFKKHPVHMWLYNADTGSYLRYYAMQLTYTQRQKLIEDMEAAAGFKLSSRPDLEDHWKLMGPAELRAVAASSYTQIGCHSQLHNNLGERKHEDAVLELRESKAYLEKVTGRSITSLAYPNGSYTRELVDAADSLGFSHQLAVNFLFNSDRNDPRIRERHGIYCDRSITEQLHLVNSKY